MACSAKQRWEPTQLTTGPLSYSRAVPSMDGKRIFAIGSQPRGELARFNQKSQQFEPYLSGISADSVDFSRDGQWVAYVTYPEGNLWRSKADGSERLQLTFAHMQVLLPRWSPDQKQIVFTGFVPGKPGRNYLISANGGTPQPVIPEEQTTDEEDPNWSPDGASIVFWFNGSNQYFGLANSQSIGRPGINRILLTSLVARRSLYRGDVGRLSRIECSLISRLKSGLNWPK